MEKPIEKIFGAKAKSIYQVLMEQGVGFYIPAYQRPYTWGKTNISRLFEDVFHGMNLLTESEDAITFIGTLILIHDTKYRTIHPSVQGQLPSRVYLVIDGQQRLTTLIIINTILHNEITLRAASIKPDKDSVSKWVHQQCLDLQADLHTTFLEDKRYGDWKYYPRMIRAFVDSWSRDKSQLKYTSPIAAHLYSYSKHIVDTISDSSKGKLLYKPKNLTRIGESESKQHDTIVENCANIRKIISKALSGEVGKDDDTVEMPKSSDIANSSFFQEGLINTELPNEIKALLLKTEPTKEESEIIEIIRLVFLTRFFLNRVAVTVVTAENESYAFDMFESLNTTGEPLTAFETFRPIVIEEEGLENYEMSVSRHYMKDIEDFMNGYEKSDARQSATSSLLIAFRLSMDGKKLSKRLSEQRSYLRSKYGKLSRIEDKQAFVQRMSFHAIFLKNLWPDEKKEKPKFPANIGLENDEVLMCLDMLKHAGHDIVISPIVQFFSNVLTQPTNQEAIKDFESAVKAVLAFSVLWRGAKGGTKGIDAHYRRIMSEGGGKGADKIKGFCFEERTDLSISEFKHLLNQVLDEAGLSKKEAWAAEVVNVPIYDASKDFARIMIYFATYDTAPDTIEKGLPVVAKSGTISLLSLSNWRLPLTIEHIAPQTKMAGWLEPIYQESNLKDTLGNLTLLFGEENTSFGNREWKVKRLMYRLLASETDADLNKCIIEAKEQRIELSKNTETLLREAVFLPHARAISQVEGDWTPELIKNRSRRMAEIIWDRLNNWLK